jgi:hypothetical protein
MATLGRATHDVINGGADTTAWDIDVNVNLSGDLTVDSPTFHVDSTNNRVGIGTITPSWDLDIYSSTNARLNIKGGNNVAIIFEDAGSSVNEKIYQLVNTAGVIKFNSLNDNFTVKNNDILVMDANGSVQTGYGIIHKTTRITSGPYNILVTDHILFVDTDSAAITVNLPAGVEGTNYKIINCGTSGNDVTVDPNGTEQLYGAGAGVASTLADGEVINIHYNATEGWW